MSMMNDIIKERRKELGLTQKELADILSISDKTVSRWESGNQIPDAILLPDLSEALKISINDLYGLKKGEPDTTETLSQSHFPKVKPWIITGYKIAMTLSLILFLFGSMLLIHLNSINMIQGEERYSGNIFLYVSIATCFVLEISYIIIYRNKGLYNPLYLCRDIKLGGLCALCISIVTMVVFPFFLAIKVSYWYELVTVMLLIVFEVMLLSQKRKLRSEGVDIGKKISIISVAMISVCGLIMLGVFIYFRFIYVDDSELWVQLIYKLSGGNPFESKVRLYSYMLLSFFMVLALLMNYLQLLMKVKKHPDNR